MLCENGDREPAESVALLTQQKRAPSPSPDDEKEGSCGCDTCVKRKIKFSPLCSKDSNEEQLTVSGSRRGSHNHTFADGCERMGERVSGPCQPAFSLVHATNATTHAIGVLLPPGDSVQLACNL